MMKNETKVEINEKPVIVKFATVNGVEFRLSDLYASLSEMLENTEENDNYGEYSLREYELHDLETTKKLVELGYIKNYTGSRMADLYCMADEKKIRELLDTLYELDC